MKWPHQSSGWWLPVLGVTFWIFLPSRRWSGLPTSSPSSTSASVQSYLWPFEPIIFIWTPPPPLFLPHSPTPLHLLPLKVWFLLSALPHHPSICALNKTTAQTSEYIFHLVSDKRVFTFQTKSLTLPEKSSPARSSLTENISPDVSDIFQSFLCMVVRCVSFIVDITYDLIICSLISVIRQIQNLWKTLDTKCN